MVASRFLLVSLLAVAAAARPAGGRLRALSPRGRHLGRTGRSRALHPNLGIALERGTNFGDKCKPDHKEGDGYRLYTDKDGKVSVAMQCLRETDTDGKKQGCEPAACVEAGWKGDVLKGEALVQQYKWTGAFGYDPCEAGRECKQEFGYCRCARIPGWAPDGSPTVSNPAEIRWSSDGKQGAMFTEGEQGGIVAREGMAPGRALGPYEIDDHIDDHFSSKENNEE